jgi:hypothetical protein
MSFVLSARIANRAVFRQIALSFPGHRRTGRRKAGDIGGHEAGSAEPLETGIVARFIAIAAKDRCVGCFTGL